MFLNFVFLVHGALAFLFGILLLFVPQWLAMQLTGANLPPVGVVFARFYGVCCFLIFLLTWMARWSPSRLARYLVLVSLLITETLGAVVSFWIPFTFLMTLSILSFLLFALVYAWILFFMPDEIGESPPPP